MGSWLSEFVLFKQFSRHCLKALQLRVLSNTLNNLPDFEQKTAIFLQSTQIVV